MTTFLKKNYVVFIALMIIMVVIILTWLNKSRFDDYTAYHHSIAKGAVSGVATQVTFFMLEQNRLVKLFASEHASEISAIAEQPEDEERKERLGEIISQYFPNHFAFTVADVEGNPYYEDFDGLVSEMCITDMKGFAREEHYEPYIHPNPDAYHFDVMAKFSDGKKQGILFISFHADVLGKILNSAQAPGHSTMLIYPKRKNLIEVVAEGARNHIIRNDYRLSDAESARILQSHDVDNTNWQAVDLYEQDLFTKYRNGLLLESTIMVLLFVAIGGLLMVRLAREEKQREIAEAKRDEAEQNRNALISVIAHEFRTPVTAIVGSMSLLGTDLEDMPMDQIRQLVTMATNNTRKLQFLINDFLDLQKLESQSLKFSMAKVELVALVKRSMEQIKMYGVQFEVSYRLRDAPQQAFVQADEQRIEQVMANLLSNAAKYGAGDHPIDISVELRDNVVRVSVRDYGPGIAPEFQPQVFEKFSTYAKQASSSENKQIAQQVPSTGLGLSICKAIIEGHGGVIGFDSELNKGSCFYFELPILPI